MGHLLEGAIAYYEATGKDKLLNALIRYADLVEHRFGTEAGKIHGYPGHEEVELALIKLNEVTKDERYLKLANYFIDERGTEPLYFGLECEKKGEGSSPSVFNYYQAGMPVRRQRDAEGHAVRAVYLYSGMADVARKTGDAELLAACERLWESITQRRMYITGSIGQSSHGEAFSFDYDLPNDTVYGETCAAIGLVFFARRMLQNRIDARYADVMERALYNGVISGMSLDGKNFFYVNPLEVFPEACQKDPAKSHVATVRRTWFGCACCPPNLARLVASLASYAFTADDSALYMHLFVGGEFTHTLNGRKVVLHVETGYPWDGAVRVRLAPEAPASFTLAFRIPGWCAAYTLSVNGAAAGEKPECGYVRLRRAWKAGDTVELRFDMPVRINAANPLVRENTGKIAVSRGPVVYCLEEADNGKNLHLRSLGSDPVFTTRFDAELLGGVTVIEASGRALVNDWPGAALYREASPAIYEKRQMVFIPYYAWANRGAGEMLVWLHR
jgi:DUF1680 family protein